jgi:hypothetical protein
MDRIKEIMTGRRQASGPDSGRWPRSSFVDKAGPTNLRQVIVDFIDAAALDGKHIIVGGMFTIPPRRIRQRFQLQKPPASNPYRASSQCPVIPARARIALPSDRRAFSLTKSAHLTGLY